MEKRKSACFAAAVAVALLLALPACAEISGVSFKTSRNVSFY